MKKKKLASEAAVGEAPVESVAAEKPVKPKKQKSGGGSLRDKQSTFLVAALILGAISILLVLLAKNGINNGKGYFVIDPIGKMKKPIALTAVKSSICAWAGAIVGFLGVGCGVMRNILKKQNSLISYLIGLIGLILAVIALLAIQYP